MDGIGCNMLDAFELIHNAREYGPRVALFGHKVNPLESPLDFIEFLRLVVDGEGKTMDTVKAYNGVLQATGIKL